MRNRTYLSTNRPAFIYIESCYLLFISYLSIFLLFLIRRHLFGIFHLLENRSFGITNLSDLSIITVTVMWLVARLFPSQKGIFHHLLLFKIMIQLVMFSYGNVRSTINIMYRNVLPLKQLCALFLIRIGKRITAFFFLYEICFYMFYVFVMLYV